MASVSLASPSFVLGPAQDPYFSSIRSLVLDGAITASLGGFEDFGSYTDEFTFTGPSRLTMEIDGTAPVPEPTSLALLGLGIAAAGIVARRKIRASR